MNSLFSRVSVGKHRIDRFTHDHNVAPEQIPGETNPPLRRIGETVPKEGTRVWLDTNCHPSFTILDTTDPAVYQVRWRDGSEGTINAQKISKNYVEAR